jgi:hypothetical protein
MSPASGAPSGFQVFVYYSNAGQPGTPLESLAGPDPLAGGLLSYDGAGLTLSSSTPYYIVVTADTLLSDGYYTWNRSLLTLMNRAADGFLPWAITFPRMERHGSLIEIAPFSSR